MKIKDWLLPSKLERIAVALEVIAQELKTLNEFKIGGQ